MKIVVRNQRQFHKMGKKPIIEETVLCFRERGKDERFLWLSSPFLDKVGQLCKQHKFKERTNLAESEFRCQKNKNITQARTKGKNKEWKM